MGEWECPYAHDNSCHVAAIDLPGILCILQTGSDILFVIRQRRQ